MSGYGNPNAQIFIIDSSVSAAEDESNSYYVGKSGIMLREMIENVLGLSIEDVYLTHALKCKPFGYQAPSSSEYATCFSYLASQIQLVAPKIIVTLGETAYNVLHPDANDFETIRGHTLSYQNTLLVPIFHPTHLIRNPSLKKEALRDLKTIKGLLG
jgi:DNA polymerase